MSSTLASSRPRVRAPKRRLTRDAEAALTPRQLEILDELEAWVLRDDFADATMAEVAKRMACSLRTLYGIAPSKDELVLIVLDRRLHRIGREAIAAMESETSPLARLRSYLRATNLAVQPTTAAFLRDYADVRGATELNGSHADYVVAVTRELLQAAIDAGEIPPLHVPSFGAVLGGLGHYFSLPGAAETLDGSAQQTANAIADVILAGLTNER